VPNSPSEEARSTATVVADSLRIAILRGGYSGGERLRQDAIATKFKVSQSVVREAFKQLIAERLLIAEPRRGVYIPELGYDDALELSILRSLIEVQALEWSIPNMVPNTLNAASLILDKIDVEVQIENLISLNSEFHMVLYVDSNKSSTLELISTLRTKFERYLWFTWRNTSHLYKSQEEHRRLVQLCAARETDAACALLRRHILGTGDVLAERLQHHGDTVV
jgi:DNA-binding GntR family transcriptional regulator